MKSAYVESSAIGRAFIHADEETYEAVRTHLRDRVGVTSRLTVLELERVLIRAEREGTPAARVAEIRRKIRQVLRRLRILEINPAVWARAAQPFAVEPVRTLDALHLATLLEWEREVGGDLVVLTRDRRISENVAAYAIPSL